MKIILFAFFISSFLIKTMALNLIEHPKEGTQYQPLIFKLTENLNFINPFDIESNKVELIITQPDFNKHVLSFFYNGLNDKNVELWEARYTPKQHGSYSFTLTINDVIKEQFIVNVKTNKNQNQGGLVLSERSGIFRYESGEAFRGIGLNVCWAPDYEYYFKKMKDAGMNFTRIWICPWHLSFEWAHTGLGTYDLNSAKALDDILKLAEKYGIFILLCIDYHGVAQKGAGYFKEDKWLESPYNKINGGPCSEAYELFTDETAKEYFRKKYKYIISRYGYSANIAAWEFYNEADLMAGRAIPVNRWHIEMAEYVHSIDAHNRLVSTSGTRNYPEKVIDAFKSPVMDFVMYHAYNVLNFAPFVVDMHETAQEYYNKPFILAEFGVDYRGADWTYKADSVHVGLHNAIWSGWFSETPVIPLSWWWDNYIDPYNLWFEFKNLSSFTSTMDFDVSNLSFKTLLPGKLLADSLLQAEAMVRCIYNGANAALWFKNDFFYWSLVNQGIQPGEIGSFYQVIPGMTKGRYTIKWYKPGDGLFLKDVIEAETMNDGSLKILVPAFNEDIACLIEKIGK